MHDVGMYVCMNVYVYMHVCMYMYLHAYDENYYSYIHAYIYSWSVFVITALHDYLCTHVVRGRGPGRVEPLNPDL